MDGVENPRKTKTHTPLTKTTHPTNHIKKCGSKERAGWMGLSGREEEWQRATPESMGEKNKRRLHAAYIH